MGGHELKEDSPRSDLYLVRKQRPREARGRVRTEEERPAGWEDDPAGDRLQVVASDAPAGALLPLPQQLLLLAATGQGQTLLSSGLHYLTGPGRTWKPASMSGYHCGLF